MKRFFEAELTHRGFQRFDFPAQSYGAGPLDDQRFFTPAACDNGEGVAPDGTITWRQGPARATCTCSRLARHRPACPPTSTHTRAYGGASTCPLLVPRWRVAR